jgi:hypothetical protein
MVKATFTFDEKTAVRLQEASERLAKPKSEVVREAIHDYYERIGQLSERERRRMLKIVDQILSRPPSRPQREVDRELRAVRQARRSGGRGSPA